MAETRRINNQRIGCGARGNLSSIQDAVDSQVDGDGSLLLVLIRVLLRHGLELRVGRRRFIWSGDQEMLF
jgi:hypothetical protein